MKFSGKKKCSAGGKFKSGSDCFSACIICSGILFLVKLLGWHGVGERGVWDDLSILVVDANS